MLVFSRRLEVVPDVHAVRGTWARRMGLSLPTLGRTSLSQTKSQPPSLSISTLVRWSLGSVESRAHQSMLSATQLHTIR